MLRYTVSFTHRAKKNLRDLPAEARYTIEEGIRAFADDPGTHHDVKKMHTSPKARPLYRLRVGDYCILMYICQDRLIIEVISVFKREGAY
jgi:mRNA-degrading endonuclease RelE of RelBE toxin-antitoxin system